MGEKSESSDDQKEFSFTNPRKRLTDGLPSELKAFWKGREAPLLKGEEKPYDIIIEGSPPFVLGPQLDEKLMDDVVRGLSKDSANRQVVVVNMLTEHERIINDRSPVVAQGRARYLFQPIVDHGVISTRTRLNLTVAQMVRFQREGVIEAYKVGNPIYAHCMAGRSRSYIAVMAFLYFYPRNSDGTHPLFDFADITKWPDGKPDNISDDLARRLKDPTFADIAEFMKIRRPGVKEIEKMDGDQAGFLGLLALEGLAEKSAQYFASIGDDQFYRSAQDVKLMLIAPLDKGFRDPSDREKQVENLSDILHKCKDRKPNLLMAMLSPEQKGRISYKEFRKNFANLSSSQQARFVILLRELEKKVEKPGVGSDPLGGLRGKSERLAQHIIRRFDELTAGDQVEFLRVFGTKESIFYDKVIAKIHSGSSIDRYNQGIQLAELYSIAVSQQLGEPLKDKIVAGIDKLKYKEQVEFLQHVKDMHAKRALAINKNQFKELVDIVRANYAKRGFLARGLSSFLGEGMEFADRSLPHKLDKPELDYAEDIASLNKSAVVTASLVSDRAKDHNVPQKVIVPISEHSGVSKKKSEDSRLNIRGSLPSKKIKVSGFSKRFRRQKRESEDADKHADLSDEKGHRRSF